MKLTKREIIDHCRRIGAPVPEILDPPPNPTPIENPYRSKLERDYASRLDTLVWTGDVEWWVYTGFRSEPGRHPLTRLKILGRRHYTPDFIVMPASGRWEMHEVKGYAREKDRLRLDAVVHEHPEIPLMIATREGREWRIRPWRR